MKVDKVYTVEALAELLKVSDRTIRKELNAGNMIGRKKLNRWYVLHSDLLEYLKS